MKKIAVTGATGFVGNFVANYLESQGCEVHRFGRKKGEKIIQWDITSAIYKNTIDFDVVIHCAANVSDWSSYKSAYSTNVIGTKNVLHSFSNASLFIYISSASIYSPFCKKKIINEDTCVGGRGLNNYGKTKLLGEQEVINSSFELKIILRPHIIYGPGDTTIGPRIKKAIRHNHLIVPGNGKNHISFTHVENLSQAIWQAIQLSAHGISPATSIYNITDKEALIFKDAIAAFKNVNGLSFKTLYIPKLISLIISLILQAIYILFGIKNAPALTPYIVRQMTNDHILNISKAKKDLQYNPTRNIKEDFLL